MTATPQYLWVPRLFAAVLWDAEGFQLSTCVLFFDHAQAGFLPPAYPEKRNALQLPAGFSQLQA